MSAERVRVLTDRAGRLLDEARELRLAFPPRSRPLARLRAAWRYARVLAEATRLTHEAERIEVDQAVRRG